MSVALGNGDGHRLPPQRHLPEISGVGGLRRQPDVDALLAEERGKIAGEDLTSLHFEIGMTLAECVEKQGHQLIRRGQRVGHPQAPRLSAGSRLSPLYSAVAGREEASRVGQEHGPGGRELDPSGRAAKERHAQRALERLYLLTDGLLGHVDLRCSPSEASALGHHHEVADLPEIGFHQQHGTPGVQAIDKEHLWEHKQELAVDYSGAAYGRAVGSTRASVVGRMNPARGSDRTD
jgi:hypothetical protein